MTSSMKFARLSIPLSTPPMEARLIASIPEGEGWQYEPKWDGFRCLVFRDGNDIELMSKSGKPLGRYFPELLANLQDCPEDRFIIDGEIILTLGDQLSFTALQARLHPAASRIAKLSRETPAQLMLFDCLQSGSDVWHAESLDVRRNELQRFASALPSGVRLSPRTYEAKTADRWLQGTGGALDGIIAKRRDQSYQPGERAMFKHKVQRTADCVIGGYRYEQTGRQIASLLLGLYDEEGLFHSVGFTSAFSNSEREELAAILEPLKSQSAFTGGSPGGASRWSNGRNTQWTPVTATKVIEVAYDQVTGARFRHGTKFIRWRPDKSPALCTFDQLTAELRPEQLEEILRAS